MVNIQVDPLFLEALESMTLNEDEKASESDNENKEDENIENESEDSKYEEFEDDSEDGEEESVNFISSTDMKIALCDFLKKDKSYKDKIEGLEDFLSELLLQVSSRKKELEEDPSIADKIDNEKTSDFFEMFYDILHEGLTNDKLAFLNAYLESKSLEEEYALVEETTPSFEKLFGKGFKPEDIKNMSDEEKKDLENKSKDLSDEDRSYLYKLLGKAWKGASEDDAARSAIVTGASSISPALGFIAHLLTGGLKRANR